MSGYAPFLKERFERCLDLYLCPRALRKHPQVDPDSLIPKLPNPKDLRPFPTAAAVEYAGHTDRVRCLATSHDGQYVASGSDDGSLRLWEVRGQARIGFMICICVYDICVYIWGVSISTMTVLPLTHPKPPHSPTGVERLLPPHVAVPRPRQAPLRGVEPQPRPPRAGGGGRHRGLFAAHGHGCVRACVRASVRARASKQAKKKGRKEERKGERKKTHLQPQPHSTPPLPPPPLYQPPTHHPPFPPPPSPLYQPPPAGGKDETELTEALLASGLESGASSSTATTTQTGVTWEAHPTARGRGLVLRFAPGAGSGEATLVRWHSKGDYVASVVPTGGARAVMIHQVGD